MMITVAPSSHKVALLASLSLNLLLLIYLTFDTSSSDGGIVQLNDQIEQHNSGALQNFVFDCDISWNREHGAAGGASSSSASSSSHDSSSKTDLMTTQQLVAAGDLAGAELNYREVSQGVLCYDKDKRFKQGARGKYWVLYNYVPARKDFRCNESITYTTHGDFTFFDNLEPLVERWQGPVSLSVYAPGSDYMRTVESILYYRECTGRNLVKDHVTFHIYFELTNIPDDIIQYNIMKIKTADCKNFPGYGEEFQTFKKETDLIYPINVARNVAREMAQTHFVFPSDIELYPSPNLIPSFLEMIRRDDRVGSATKPRVYVNSIFEIEVNSTLPNDKVELVKMLDKGVVIPFHKQVCPSCHKIPYAKAWVSADVKSGMQVIHVGKRVRPYQHWEPIYIGTNEEPWYDERLSWEGRSDKMSQGYKLCLLDYEFHILDNAFLVHRPGIKTKAKLKGIVENKKVSAQNTVLHKVIYPEIKKLYSIRKGCEMFA
jgi:hypothetical protein